ncbi:tRNA pseudouridine(38-40) synthase TruA [Exiguobacterium sp. SL-10]|uniref:tRNA pseudouridine(38-40) synthase TruA n=1 Tax=unclassified Exiguobacterium TaxID=2644629 RepID=UPI001038E1FF|nr:MULTISPECIES: tRNA pseudouridine(38-40) synthase TruA [unclassified Exiguobacterium]TCI20358.1 tRNA pseudouridine(38-40) synthase TruA [Exiguobacterium sp. SL-9]TCI28438.1 tRNA pseudouridine(38-40) synthase TruA [Exiguobacterium sp. SL-10]
MKRIKLTIAYDGTNYAGYQVQPNGNTIQAEVEAVLARMHSQTVKVVASGRTDARVHARGQVLHFDTHLAMPADRFVKALNAMLPDDILVRSAEEVDASFHARYGAKRKEYRYFFRSDADPFRRHHAVTVTYKLDHERMRQALRTLVGTHDFTSFSVTKAEVEDRVRTIYEAELVEAGDEMYVRFVGSGFLYNQVRIMVGTLLEVGRGKYEPADVSRMLASKDRRSAGITAPPHGLYLWNVNYEKVD